ncbi:plasmid pRiA4b ORF-3 family protein [Sphingomonas sp. KR3-1]|uniref:plasmid pRiA4b ORF-3 family protein n=1 Tax=Sphingomonas sp. KR3-1 TaxID=3156611 RepID=UPI0032B420ED
MLDFPPLIARIEVQILHIAPPITRTFELPFSYTLSALHHILQTAFGWKDQHLHRFEIGGLNYGPPDPEQDDGSRRTFNSSTVRLEDFALRYGEPIVFLYEYDFGDRWVHAISLNVAVRDAAARYPRCTGGSRAGPPENSGGAEGYAKLLDAWGTPGNPDHKETRKWAGRRFDPERFDLSKTDEAVQEICRVLRLRDES